MEARKRRGQQRTRWLDGVIDSMDMCLSKLLDMMEYCSPWVCKESDTTKRLNNNKYMCYIFFIHLSVDGHLVCFHVLAIANNAAVNTGVHVCF